MSTEPDGHTPEAEWLQLLSPGKLDPIHFCHVDSSGQFGFGLQSETPLIRSHRETFAEGPLCFSEDPEVPGSGLGLSREFSSYQEKGWAGDSQGSPSSLLPKSSSLAGDFLL